MELIFLYSYFCINKKKKKKGNCNRSDTYESTCMRFRLSAREISIQLVLEVLYSSFMVFRSS